MEQPLVSVIIPVYNAERWLKKTLQSVRGQTHRNIEIVIVDDGSNDGSLDIARSFAGESVKILNQEQGGPSRARNLGFQNSSGEFIQYLDADDILGPTKIESQVSRLLESRRDDAIATCAWARFWETRTEVDGSTQTVSIETRFVPELDWRDLSPIDWLCLEFGGGGTMPPVSWLLPRKIIEQIGPWDDRFVPSEDTEFITRAVLKSSGFLFCPDAEAFYRSGLQGSQSALKDRVAQTGRQRCLKRCEEWVLGFENSKRTRKAMANAWRRLAFATYPQQADITAAALARAAELGGGDVFPSGGPIFRILSSTFGWKRARQLQWMLCKFRKKTNVASDNPSRIFCASRTPKKIWGLLF